MALYGFVYVLRNDAMPDLYKIGFTDRSPNVRCAELSAHTGVPFPFEVVVAAEVEEPQQLESEIHADYSLCRVNNSREFFMLTIEQVVEISKHLQDRSTFSTILKSSHLGEIEEMLAMREAQEAA